MTNGTPVYGRRKYRLAWTAMIGTFVVVGMILLLAALSSDSETLRHAITKVADMWPWAVAAVLALYGGANVATHFAQRNGE